MTLDTREFRNALGRFATGVAIVAAEVDGHRIGATISSFNSVSLDPPLVLFSLARSAYSFAQWKAARALAISLLAEHQTELSNRFARSGEHKWAGIEDRRAANNAPLVPGWVACFECEPYAVYDGGDHEIFVCRVTGFKVSAADSHPLVFYAGKYRSLRVEDGAAIPPDDNMWLHGW